MVDSNFSELAEKLDLLDMAGFTRKFVRDISSALEYKIDMNIDADWSGVICLGLSLIHI